MSNFNTLDYPTVLTYISVSKLTYVKHKRTMLDALAKKVRIVSDGNIIQLHPRNAGLAGFLRVGHTGHRQLEALIASGRRAYDRFVFDAAHIDEQVQLVETLRASGCEIVLDPNFAEMGSTARYKSSSLNKLAWANPERPWQATDFQGGRNLDWARAIAEFAVQRGATVVLAPSHYIENASDPWHRVDQGLCEDLRRELDRVGGQHIAIDYQLLFSSALLRNEEESALLVAGVSSLPIQNVWVRVSGMGADATGVGTRHFIEAIRRLHEVDRPLIADCLGGLAGLSAMAFGAVGAISHGVGQKEAFRASDWSRPSGGGGQVNRVYVSELDRHVTEDQLRTILAAKGGKALLACNDSGCCPHGAEDMLENSRRHFLTQRNRQIRDLSSAPELRRAEHFLLKHVNPAVRNARRATLLKGLDEDISKIVKTAKGRLDRFSDALADLHANAPPISRSRAPQLRGVLGKTLSAVVGR